MAYPASSIGNQWAAGFTQAPDLHSKIDVPLDAIAALVNAGPYGSVGHNVLASPVTGITTGATTLATVTVAVVSGRKYRIASYFEGIQNTTTGNLLVEMKIAGSHAEYLWFQATSPSTVYGHGDYLYIPGSSASVTFLIAASTSAGTLSASAGAFILVEDIGTT